VTLRERAAFSRNIRNARRRAPLPPQTNQEEQLMPVILWLLGVPLVVVVLLMALHVI